MGFEQWVTASVLEKVRRGKGPASSDGRTPSSYAEANCLRNSGNSERGRHD